MMKDGTGGKQGIFTGKVRCGDCGNTYGPKVWHSNDKYRKVIWQCNSKFKNKCKTPNITEEEMKNAFLRALNDIAPNRRHYVNKLETMIEEIGDLSGLEEERRDLDRQLEIDWKKVNDLINENARTVQNQKEYEAKYEAAMKQYTETESKQKETAEKISNLMTRRKKIERFIEEIRKFPETVTEFDDMLWNVLVESLTVEKERMIFRFCSGLEITVIR